MSPVDHSGTPSSPQRRLLGDFELLSLIGRGGMGEVWEAEQRSVGRRVALKLLPEDYSRNPRSVLRFRREAQAGGQLSHPNIATIYDAGLAEGRLYIAQELIEGGRTLADFLSEHQGTQVLRPEYFERVASLTAQVASALQHAHDQGIIHRDVKPQNVLLTEDGLPKLVDFGLARFDDGFTLTQSGEVSGTYAYMSPEQARARSSEVDHRTDVFSLGAMLYELLTLRRPFEGDSVHEITERILNETPTTPMIVRPEVPGALSVCCMRAIQKRPRDRFESMGALRSCLCTFDGQGEGPAETSAMPSATRRSHLKRLLSLKARFVGLLILVLFLGVGVVAWQWVTASDKHMFSANKSPFGQLANFSEIQAFAREQIEINKNRYEQDSMKGAVIRELQRAEVSKVQVHAVRLSDAIASVPALEGVRIGISQSAQEWIADGDITFELDLRYPVSALAVFELLLEQASLIYVAEPDGIVVVCTDAESVPLMLRAFPVWDLVSQWSPEFGAEISHLRLIDDLEDGGDDTDASSDLGELVISLAEQLKGIIQEVVEPEIWEQGNSYLFVEFDTIVVVAEDRVLEKIAGFLEDLRRSLLLSDTLSASGPAHRGVPKARNPAEERLDGQVLLLDGILGSGSLSVEFFERLEERIGMDIVIHDWSKLGERSQYLDDVSGFSQINAYQFLEGALEGAWLVANGIVHVGYCRVHNGVSLGLYPVWDLLPLERGTTRGFTEDVIEELIITNVFPYSWHSRVDWSITMFQGLFVIMASDAAHHHIEQLLEELRASAGTKRSRE